MKTLFLLGALAASSSAMSVDATTVFGPASGVIVINGIPAVTIGATSGTAIFGSAVTLLAKTGSLSAATGAGTIGGTVSFSDTVGATVADIIPGFLTFADGSGGNFVFDTTSAQTVAYSSNASETSIGLYLLGSASDPTLGFTPGPTSVTVTLNKTGQSAFSASATIAAPPSGGIPEPASWAMMLSGFGLAGASLRLKSKARAA